jgi:hypothetical protein
VSERLMDDQPPATTANAGGAVLARPARDARVPWLLAGAVAVAAGLRLPFLAQQSLWIDETFTRQIALAPHLSDVWSMVKVTESTPPAFYWLCWAVMHGTGSESDAMLRLSSAVAGTPPFRWHSSRFGAPSEPASRSPWRGCAR